MSSALRTRLHWHVWLLWAAALALLATCPMLLSDPGMWPYLFDPELLAFVIVVGAQFARLELGVVLLRMKIWAGGRLRTGTARPRPAP
jgi:hypothetical protein